MFDVGLSFRWDQLRELSKWQVNVNETFDFVNEYNRFGIISIIIIILVRCIFLLLVEPCFGDRLSIGSSNP